jgi:hypothetical protein
MALTTNGGRSDGTTPSYREITPSCFAFTYTPKPCDPAPRFVAPFEADQTNPTTWVAGGQYVWLDTKGWNTTCGGGSTALPDAPGDDIVLTKSGKLVVASDIGVFIATAGQGSATTWSRLGTLPHASVNDLQLSPDGSYIIAATHGRGLWKITTP